MRRAASVFNGSLRKLRVNAGHIYKPWCSSVNRVVVVQGYDHNSSNTIIFEKKKKKFAKLLLHTYVHTYKHTYIHFFKTYYSYSRTSKTLKLIKIFDSKNNFELCIPQHQKTFTRKPSPSLVKNLRWCEIPT